MKKTIAIASAFTPAIAFAQSATTSTNGRYASPDALAQAIWSGRDQAARESAAPWESRGLVGGCLLGPIGCFGVVAAAEHSDPVPQWIPPLATAEERLAFERAYDQEKRKKHRNAALKGGAGGMFVVPLMVGGGVLGLVAMCSLPNANCAPSSGRPFRVDERPTLPLLFGFGGDGEPDPIGRWWLDSARAEAASVPAFVRMAEELRVLGAPGDLVNAALRAAQEEVEHAQACFLLANAHGAGAWSAAPMDAAPRWREPSFDALHVMAKEAWLDGCLGEAVAARVAALAAESASSVLVRDVQRKIAREEASHGELAWRVLAWAMRNGDVRDAIGSLDAACSATSHLEGADDAGVPSATASAECAARTSEEARRRLRRIRETA